MNLASTRIVTTNVRSLAEFYETITGVAPVYGSEEFAELRTATGTLAINSVRSSDRFGAGAATAASNRSVVIEFMVDDVDAERERLRPLVARCELEPTNLAVRIAKQHRPINFYKPLKREAAE